ncbi:Aspartyl/asparaginy/proline hydroxylase [uncultured Caudovirales phage]|uniref:Aspartyl/asparaginy/proline hydroxylase n=1 Tax=uncultured Caudovirales phage TaxID=2100421 RepID=A0A6J5KYL7_9CAUD|nr:Aspartyl/asparaginy/proline hydroxylase [uncultured Caudovirales phage]CAB5208871.1 Aspartyl/asparaginy/proline hydroxylase [uncultured Caudovirales phage]
MIDALEAFIKESTTNQWAPSWPLPTDVFNSDWPWVPVEFDADFKKMHEECITNDHLFVGHRQKDRQHSYNHDGWAALTLHGINATATENYEQYGFASAKEANYHWTEVCELFPVTTAFIKSLNYRDYDRVRIMKLRAGGYIMPHVDGQGRIFGPLNIAINNPEGCGFYFKKWGQVPFKQGTGNFLDIGNEHIVWNNSTEDRYHIIVHGGGMGDLYNYTYNQMKTRYENK